MPRPADAPCSPDASRGAVEPPRVQKPFEIRVADRIATLPPYLFARINQLTYQKRRSGHDIIDMSMGNPADPPPQMAVEKLAEAAADPRNHG